MDTQMDTCFRGHEPEGRQHEAPPALGGRRLPKSNPGNPSLVIRALKKKKVILVK